LRVFYRARQFFGGLFARVSEADRREAEAVLPPLARTWFRSLPPDLQRHGLLVMRDLRAAGFDRPDVLTAALLHDAGKAEASSGPIQRAIVVLARKLAPAWVARRARRDWQSARGLDRLLTVAAQHPQIAAEKAARYGCDPVTIELIRRHQDQWAGDEPLLQAFQRVDDRR
jgi:hypothetical protein